MKIAWAIEPSGLKSKHLVLMNKLIGKFKGKSANPELVHVEGLLFAGGIDPFGGYRPVMNERNAKKDVESALKQAQIKINSRNLHFETTSVSSISSSVERFLKKADSLGCDCIAIFTKANKGITRWVMGSFAETVVNRSKKDLLLLNPNSNWNGAAIKRSLFLDDFSLSSKKYLKKALLLCRELKSDLVVYHVPHITYDWNLETENPFVKKYRKSVEQRKKWILDLGSELGVNTTVVLGKFDRAIHESAFDAAKKHKVDLIVVTSKAGAMTAFLGGSITRYIMRGSLYPVYVQK